MTVYRNVSFSVGFLVLTRQSTGFISRGQRAYKLKSWWQWQGSSGWLTSIQL
jgi:hypothetical protein